jgi:hypothetical protein
MSSRPAPSPILPTFAGDTRRRVHSAWLQCRIERRTSQFHAVDVRPCCPESTNIGVSRRVVVFGCPVGLRGQRYIIADNGCGDRRVGRIGGLDLGKRHRLAHPAFVIIGDAEGMGRLFCRWQSGTRAWAWKRTML